MNAAKEFQRREQQGLGRPIISAVFEDHRVVAVGGLVYASKKWKTFHDFLNDYPRILLGMDWWQAEAAKALGDMHLILKWAMRSYEQRSDLARSWANRVQPVAGTGAMSAYMRFAYDLYHLKHAVEVEELLIRRLKCHDNFPGAFYEVRVAAALLRAGFDLQPQDETSRRSTHVEFIATHKASGTIYTVEAKRREGKRLNINQQLSRALKKHSDHSRIVFIDTNDKRLDMGRGRSEPVQLVEAESQLIRYERDAHGKTLPPAYVIVTHDPSEHHLDAVGYPIGMLLWGFHLEDLHPGEKPLIQQVQTRRRHAPIFDLLASMDKHRHIPATFDGEANAFLGDSPEARLQVGQRMEVPGPGGSQIDATLESGIVLQQRKVAACVMCSDDQQRFIVEIPMTDAEVQAHAQHPKTFFGVIDRNAGRPRINSVLDMFDALWETYANSPRERLLEFLERAPDIEQLRAMNQEDLATEYCARMASSLMQHMRATPG